MKNNSHKNTHSFVNIPFLFLISLFFISSCDKKKDIQEIPSYIHIENVNLTTNSSEGKNTHNITDIWVYVESDTEIEFRGTYPLPATIPLLKTDSTKIYIRAGIKDNGISGTRVKYSFYKTFETDIFLVKDSIANINPDFEYVSNANFEIENFEGVGTNIDTTLKSDIDFEVKTEGGNKYAHAILDDNNLIFEVATEEFKNLPQVGAPVYIELDYKCNHDFMVGTYINYPFSVVNRELLWVTPKEDWNKIYINMTQTVSQAINNNSIKFYINMFRTDTTEDAWIEFDNLKIIH